MIETIVSMPAVSLSLFVVGVVCGAVVASIVLPSRREVERLTAELAALRNEHESYKGNVSKHFLKTSELVANMTASYKAVYDHLATGAQSLCSDTEALEAPKFGSPKLIFDPTIEIAPKTATDAAPAAADIVTAQPHSESPPEPSAETAPESASKTPQDSATPPQSETVAGTTDGQPESEWRLGEPAAAGTDESRSSAEPPAEPLAESEPAQAREPV